MKEHDVPRTARRLETPCATFVIEPAGVATTPIDPSGHTLDVYLGGAVSDYVSVGEETYEVPCPPGSFRFLRAGSVRELRTVRSGTTLRALVRTDALDALVGPGRLAGIGVEHRHDDPLIGAATILVDAFEDAFPGDDAADAEATPPARVAGRASAELAEHACQVLLGRLAHRLARDAAPAGAARRPDAVQCAIEFVEANLHRALTLERVAESVGLSQYHFARLFRREMNTSLQRHVIARRVARAEELLRRTDDALADIAYRVGFGSQSHMTTLFRKHAGRTPGQLRREVVSRATPPGPCAVSRGRDGEAGDGADPGRLAGRDGPAPDDRGSRA